ncbi:MAG: hypothetical protein PHQ23_00560, partial [Candidatus Wallbacteria bacterium]|nr:hypothetical protein [Candidatus Wallbacteria bacterium]
MRTVTLVMFLLTTIPALAELNGSVELGWEFERQYGADESKRREPDRSLDLAYTFFTGSNTQTELGLDCYSGFSYNSSGF